MQIIRQGHKETLHNRRSIVIVRGIASVYINTIGQELWA